jgi:hypothetical protein
VVPIACKRQTHHTSWHQKKKNQITAYALLIFTLSSPYLHLIFTQAYQAMQKSIVIITPKDIQLLMGNSYKTACRIHRQIRQFVGKLPGQLITIDDFCTFTGLTHKEVQLLLNE